MVDLEVTSGRIISASGVVPSQRAAWCHLEHPKFGKIEVLVVYAPNFDSERATLWNELADLLDKNREWIVAGDFNMVEALQDRRGGSGRILNGREKSAWNRFSRRLCLEDTFCYKPGHLK